LKRPETARNGEIRYFTPLNELTYRHYLDSQFAIMLGFSSMEWVDPSFWLRRLHPEDRDRVLLEINKNLTHGSRYKSEYRVLAQDGRVVWIRDEGIFRRDRDAKFCFIDGIISNITEEKDSAG
jgi:PAS domain S-box-containing protein